MNLNFKRIEKYLNGIKFDYLLYRLILEHGSEYCNKYYDRGEEPKINNKLYLLLNYIKEYNTLEYNKKLNLIGYDYNNFFFSFNENNFSSIEIYNDEDMRRIFKFSK